MLVGVVNPHQVIIGLFCQTKNTNGISESVPLPCFLFAAHRPVGVEGVVERTRVRKANRPVIEKVDTVWRIITCKEPAVLDQLSFVAPNQLTAAIRKV
jgi:hypothetical protein